MLGPGKCLTGVFLINAFEVVQLFRHVPQDGLLDSASSVSRYSQSDKEFEIV